MFRGFGSAASLWFAKAIASELSAGRSLGHRNKSQRRVSEKPPHLDDGLLACDVDPGEIPGRIGNQNVPSLKEHGGNGGGSTEAERGEPGDEGGIGAAEAAGRRGARRQ